MSDTVTLPLVEAAKKSDLFEASVAERVVAIMREAINKAVNGEL